MKDRLIYEPLAILPYNNHLHLQVVEEEEEEEQQGQEQQEQEREPWEDQKPVEEQPNMMSNHL